MLCRAIGICMSVDSCFTEVSYIPTIVHNAFLEKCLVSNITIMKGLQLFTVSLLLFLCTRKFVNNYFKRSFLKRKYYKINDSFL